MRSKWSNIHLIGICKTKHFKKYGTTKFLNNFIETLLKLQNRFQMQIGGREVTVYGVLTAVLADTPAAAFVTDIKQSTTLANKEASRLYAELLLCVCWHTEHI